ncbi:hypothetical protein AcW1_006736 [Taiwanofungus camphoratus]|nr:hypothetical protein AcV5_009325 [Antrodia cinnamomea]KAI0955027.1 hypothetical protein AcW1_006736 [Antrodia cinnamomea]
MVSLSISSSRSSSVHSSRSQNSFNHNNVSPSPSSSNFSSSSSSSGSLNRDDDENITITASRPLLKNGKERSHDDLRLLAVSTHITELSYTISDIQTRIFEIQELRHKSQTSEDTSKATSVIDQSLSNLDDRLESVSAGIKSINESLEPILKRSEKTPTLADEGSREETLILRKHAAMTSEWEAVQKEIQVLREELKEDKWLTVFRTVTDQADGMMSSLEKAVNRCQDFIWQIQRRGLDDSVSQSSSTSSVRSEKSPLNFDVFTSLLDSFEAKKKHYMPATTKVLSIIDKGVQDRVTKNGECLRRHAESTQRWRNLKERIARTDTEMEAMRKMLLNGDLNSPSEAGSSTSGPTSKSKNGFLATPPSGSRSSKERTHGSGNTLSRSISPFRKLARKIAKSSRSPGAATPSGPHSPSRMPSSEPVRTLRHRASMLHFLGSQPPTPITPSHKHSQSLTPDSSPSSRKVLETSVTVNNSTLKSRPAWNSSTKVEPEDRALTAKPSGQRRPSVTAVYRSSDDTPSVPPLYPSYNRSVSRSSMASSRPWSPVTSSVSTAQSSTPAVSMYRPPSRSHTPGGLSMFRPPSRAQTPGNTLTSPRTRPKTPSHIPAPSRSQLMFMSSSLSDAGWDDPNSSILQRAFSPTYSRAMTPGGSTTPARPPSRSMIPIPSVHISSASRPSSAMSQYRPESSMSFRASAGRARTPEGLLRMTPRSSVIQSRMPPSSFRESASPRTPSSRPSSRAGAATPSQDGNGPLHVYVPANLKDPLDAEVANIVNSMSHGLLVERIDPPLRSVPRESEEIRAQYAFSNTLARKVVTCKLTTMARSGTKGVTRKVMCRVGGGWQDLHLYVMSRQS